MNASSEPKSIEQLLREGVQAARNGNKATARDRLREVVKRDEQNEKGWIWLASVIDDPNEKRLCLSNVLVINPGNTTARRELAALEKSAAETETSRKRSRAPLLLLLVTLVIVLVGAFLITRQLGLLTPTVTVPTASPSGAQVADNATNNSAAPTTSGTITDTPTITNTPTRTLTPLAGTQSVIIATIPPLTLPPTWTPQASSTSALGVTGTPLGPPPAGLKGHLVVMSGQSITPDGFLPIEIMSPDGSNVQPIVQFPDRGEYGLILADGQHILYSYITAGTGSIIMRISNLNGSQPRDVSGGWGNFPALADQHAGSLSTNGQFLAFSAHNILQNELYSAIYVLNITPFLKGTVGATPTTGAITATPISARPGRPTFTPVPPTPTKAGTLTATPSAADLYLVRVTPKGIGDNDWAAISPDGKNVAFVTDTSKVGVNGIDLYSAPVRPDSQPKQLTPDGATFYKSAPAWSPDGKQIAFTSAPLDNSSSNVEIIEANGANRRVLAHLDKTHNFRPHWSPDGKYLAFTSDRTGKDEVFILNMTSMTLYQVTHDANLNILTDWGP
ncbi:MAG: hypothetical protein ACYDBJ_15245 [Aggregatilineales bacterium]